MTAKTTIGIVAAVLLLGPAGAGAQQAPDFNRTFQSVTPEEKKKQKAAPKEAVKKAAPKPVVQRPPQKRVVQRAPTRIVVRPLLRNRHDSTEFPRSDNLGYPGRNAVRQCTSWLATEYRLSGTVVTPQMRCWWQRG
jgi:hypothetical protein